MEAYVKPQKRQELLKKLNRSFHGLKDSDQTWNKLLLDKFKRLRSQEYRSGSCVFEKIYSTIVNPIHGALIIERSKGNKNFSGTEEVVI